MINIFVYGTLMEGMYLHRYISGRLKGYALLESSSMYEIDWYPGVVNGNELTFGEIYEIDNYKLCYIDEIEDFKEEDPFSVYVRRKTKVVGFNGEKIDVYYYFYNGSVKDKKPISICDYRRYKLEKSNRFVWLVSYGSSVDSKILERKVGLIKECKPCFIKNFRLSFNKVSEKGTMANIIFDRGSLCPAVLRRVSLEQLERLDVFKGAPIHYYRVTVPVLLDNLKKIIAEVYIANPNFLTEERLPKREYLEHITKGYEEFNLDIGYLENILTRLEGKR